MIDFKAIFKSLRGGLAVILATAAVAQAADVALTGGPYVPTPPRVVEEMLRVAGVTNGDFVIDLGSGDGITEITAYKQFGLRATGIEYNQDMVELSKRNAQK